MKRILALICLIILVTWASAGTGTATATATSKTASFAGKLAPNVVSNWFSVAASDLKLWVGDSGLYGGWYQDNNKGLLFHISTPRDPDHRNGSYALHSNPTNDGGYYGNNWDHWAAMPVGVPIPAGSTASVSYWAHWNLENQCDGVELQIATSQDNYTTWTGLHPTGTVEGQGVPIYGPLLPNHYYYTGIYGDYGIWDQQWICDLAPYIGKTVKLRFRLTSDTSNVETGFFVDDLDIIANGSVIASYGFEIGDTSMWVTDMYWGRTVQSLWTENLLFQGEVLAGVSSSYVVDVFSSDWQAFGADYGPPLHLRQTNRWTAPAGQPKFDLDTYYYAPSGSGGGRYIIADCYLKRVDDDVDFNGLYIALHMEPRVSIPFHDYTYYNSEHKMIWLNYLNHPELTCMGMMYLAPNSGNPNAARIRDPYGSYWGNDTQLYQEMSVPGFDTQLLNSKCYTMISAGPYSSSGWAQCTSKRFTFAFVAADRSSELYDNATACRAWYDANLADDPQDPTKVAPTSLGNIKALYK